MKIYTSVLSLFPWFVASRRLAILPKTNGHLLCHLGGILESKISTHIEILLAEDEPITRRIVVASLERAGFKMRVVNDGAECLELLTSGYTPDLLLLDLAMPKTDGLEVLRNLHSRKLIDNFPVAVFTAKHDQDLVLQISLLGVMDYIIKPFDAKDLTQRIMDLVMPLSERDLHNLLINLRMPDNSMFRAPEFRDLSKKGFDAYLTTHGAFSVCVLSPTHLSPKSLAQLSPEELLDKITVFRQQTYGWRKIWPSLVVRKKLASAPETNKSSR